MNDRVVLHPLPIEAEWTDVEQNFLPRLASLDLDFEVEVQPQGLVGAVPDLVFDLLISVPWDDLPAHFSGLLGALVAWRAERTKRPDEPKSRGPYRVQVLFAGDGSVLKEVEIPEPE